MRRGEVWWAEHPNAGRRPYLILTRDAAIAVRQRITVSPASRTVRGIPSEVALDEDDGMPSVCAFSFDTLLTVPKHSLVERICTLPAERMHEACQALRAALDC